ncbi:MAG: hypothetical protein ACKVJS_02615 [Flavobacteriales bacterium]|jgi:uncharacterized protein involved in exopolysaccharide biosynthesis|tara:strand:+ start:11708 stop:12751 length:1044 start_codon:yes stop_codon:yes gene_type:complete
MKNEEEVFSLINLTNRLKELIYFLLEKKNKIFYGTISVVFFFLSYNYLVSPTHFARTSFVLDNDSSQGMGELSSIASLAGINPSSFIDASSLFQIDNIQELYKSSSMIKNTLLSRAKFNGKFDLIINKLIKIENINNRWSSEKIEFNNSKNLTRAQDSVIKVLVKKIKEKHLLVYKPSRKTTIIEIGFDHKDEQLAKVFNENLVAIVNKHYLKTKTIKTGFNLEILQKEADSVKLILNSSLEILAELDQNIPNANPLLKTSKVPYQQLVIDIQANTAIYSEVVKQLELAKVTHRNNTPLIQIIDSPILPLDNSRLKLFEILFYGISIGFISMISFYLVINLFQNKES